MTTDLRTLWQERLPEELAFWDAWLASRGSCYGCDPEEFRQRFDPTTPLQQDLRDLIDNRDSDTLRLLDVGAGPATMLGKHTPGWHVKIEAIDPLAPQYAQLLWKYGLTAPVHTWRATAEEVGELFQPDTFDLAYARNSLDHAVNPRLAVQGMYRVIKPGGAVYLLHHDREADRRGGQGLHRWNFYPRYDGYMMEPLGGECGPITIPGMTMRAIGDQTEVVIRKPL
jgi:SAM-dependent methyltransferase